LDYNYRAYDSPYHEFDETFYQEGNPSDAGFVTGQTFSMMNRINGNNNDLAVSTAELVSTEQEDPWVHLTDSTPAMVSTIDCLQTASSMVTHGNPSTLRNSNKRFPCLEIGCDKSFGRQYDASRHYESIHVSVSKYWCRYPLCKRATSGFVRKDKCIDHERRLHQMSQGRQD
jgi:hypothetical protein